MAENGHWTQEWGRGLWDRPHRSRCQDVLQGDWTPATETAEAGDQREVSPESLAKAQLQGRQAHRPRETRTGQGSSPRAPAPAPAVTQAGGSSLKHEAWSQKCTTGHVWSVKPRVAQNTGHRFSYDISIAALKKSKNRRPPYFSLVGASSHRLPDKAALRS